MDYSKDMINRFLDMYERRGAFDKDASSLRAIQIEVKKAYPQYADRYNHEAYRDINTAIDKLKSEGIALAEQDSTGKYTKVRMNTDKAALCYSRVKRISIPEQCERVRKTISEYSDTDSELVKRITDDWLRKIDSYEKLPYDLKYDHIRTDNVLRILQEITGLECETYIRNFSTAVFKNSKTFQKEYKSCIESVLFDYTDETVEKDRILEFYNLYENPTYVLIKGDAVIRFGTSVLYLNEMPGGISLPNSSLEKISSISVNSKKIITVENLTAYHDSDEPDAVHIYLGGFHNHSKQTLLEKIYSENSLCEYYHKGDPDVYGFLILENLKSKTGIPFKPLQMDLSVLEKFCKAGMVRELTSTDVKMIRKNIDTSLSDYADVLEFMLEHNCKAEQESFKAMEMWCGVNN